MSFCLKFILLTIIMINDALSYSNQNYDTLVRYENINNIEEFEYGGMRIRVYSNSQYSAQRAKRKISNIIDNLNAFYSNRNMNRCNYYRPLEIFIISLDTLNNHQIMSFLNWGQWSNRIRGVYTSSTSGDENASIFVSNDSFINTTLSHELSHYWQDIYCLPQNEQESRSFEKFSTRRL